MAPKHRRSWLAWFITRAKQMKTTLIPLSYKKEWHFTICNNMDGLEGCYVQWNMSEKDKCYMLSFIGGIWKTNQTSEYNEKRIDLQI